ncbi:Metallo-dependent hydrolase [Lentithecium fluviatile CBS 122367]|uniref:Dipeptidase n=1 Tax=Lentithecium fluviatile CBS 122367 TaxID=1168545 RepID=A0A6G1ICW4_9PLEO|nr:Metallo-dependent hydrolase [Lentithecium fluviatile CBS 122367]
MVTFSPDFVGCHWPEGHAVKGRLPARVGAKRTVAQVLRHMRYIGDFIRYEHVSVANDFDGVPFVLGGLEVVAIFPALVKEMLGQGTRDEVARGIVGGNLMGVWGRVAEVAKGMQADGVVPADDGLTPLDDPWKEWT